MKITNKRTETITIRVTKKDVMRVKRLAKNEESSVSDIIRKQIKRAYEKHLETK